jgi:ATP-binding cassette subfamily B protein
MLPAIAFYLLRDGLSAALTMAAADVLAQFADAVFSADFAWGLQNIWKLLLCVAGAVLVIPAVELLGEKLMFAQTLKHDVMVFGRFFDKEYASALALGGGDAQYRLENDPNEFRVHTVNTGVRLISAPLILCYLIIRTSSVNFIFTLVIVCLSLIKLLVPLAVRRIEAKYDAETREYRTRVREYETEIARRPHALKMLNLKDRFVEKLDSIFKEHYASTQKKSIERKAAADNTISLVNTLCMLIILITGAVMAANGIIDVGSIAAMTVYFSLFGTVFEDAGSVIRDVPILKNLYKRVFELYSHAEAAAGESISEIDCVRAEKLSFSFGGKTVFSELDFTVKKGEKVAIRGGNGSGKTTLVNIICALLKGFEGKMLVNGKRIEDISAKSLRECIAYASQDAFLFSGGVRDNIRAAAYSADGEPDDAEDDAEELLGIQKSLLERGVSGPGDISGGEKQKISIARSFIKGAGFIILDEPTNNLDDDAALRLKSFIRDTDKTVLFISHDDELCALADRELWLGE